MNTHLASDVVDNDVKCDYDIKDDKTHAFWNEYREFNDIVDTMTGFYACEDLDIESRYNLLNSILGTFLDECSNVYRRN